MRKNAQAIGKLLITTCNQSSGAPIIDRGFSDEKVAPFRKWKCKVIHLTPWRKDKYGDRLPGKALVIGWQR